MNYFGGKFIVLFFRRIVSGVCINNLSANEQRNKKWGQYTVDKGTNEKF